MTRSEDTRFMRAALALGDRNAGRTGVNPSVGAIVVRQGVVLGAAATAVGGRVHAEATALAMAGDAACGATLYVTLEPCAYRSDGSASCQSRILDSGVREVVIARLDPNPRIAGRSVVALRSAGLDVRSGVAEREAARSLAGHLTWHRKSRPHVIVKQAVSSDGHVGAVGRRPVALTSSAANAQVHLMRARVDAILVGAATAASDDPMLTCRLPGLADRSPYRVVVGRGAAPLSSGSRLVRTASEIPTTLLCPAVPRNADELTRRGVTILLADDLTAGLAALGAKGVRTVLVEAGGGLMEAFAEAGLVDAYELFETPVAIGAGGVPAKRGKPLASWLHDHHYTRYDRRRLGPDVWHRYERGTA